MDSNSSARFQATRWSLINRARQGDEAQRARALADLCADYRAPLLNFLCRKCSSREDAEDIIQGFLEKMCTAELIERAAPVGQFRTFLINALENHRVDTLRKAGAKKRGEGITHDAIGTPDIDNPAFDVPDPALAPDEQLQRDMDRVTVRKAIAKMEAKFGNDPKTAGILRLFLEKWEVSAESPPVARDEFLHRYGVSENALSISLTRMKTHFRDALREAVLATVGDDEDVDSEIRRILASFLR